METQPSNAQSWLAETKFHPPRLHADAIPRQRLLDNLYSALATHPLTLLSAPAGYGKTSLLAALSQTQPDLPLAWLSLDEEDNDPARFLTALITALQRLNSDCGKTALSLLTGLTNPGSEARRVSGVLINDILETLSDPFALILDDLHLISEPTIFAALDYLLEHLPPHMHLVAATRVDPPVALARLRARGQLAELRLAELRFTDQEASAFLNDQLHLGLSTADLELFQSRTEGWAVGLRLLANSLNQLNSAEDRQLFIHHLMQTNRYIFDFLAEEVYNHQEREVKDFLLETAILIELTPTLCQSVTGRSDARTVLVELYRRNLFLIQVFPSQESQNSGRGPAHLSSMSTSTHSPQLETQYRYHDLFAEFLRRKLQEKWPQRIPDLHQRAAQVQNDPVRAISHYLAAGSWQAAAEIIERIGSEMFARGYQATLKRWINALPASIRENRPRLLHLLSNCAFWKGAWEEVEPLLQHALQGFKAAGDEAGQGEVLADLAVCAAFRANLERSSTLHGQALAYPIPLHTRIQSLLGRAVNNLVIGNWGPAERDFNAAMALIPETGALDRLHLMTFYFFDPGFAFLPGGLKHLERICRQAKAQVGDEISLSRLAVEEEITVLHLLRGHIREAIITGEAALRIRERLGGHAFLSLDAALYLMIAHSVRGDYAAAEPLFDKVFLAGVQTDPPQINQIEVLYHAGRVRWLQGRLKEAHTIYHQMSALEDYSPYPPAHTYCTWMYVLVEMAAGRYGRAERALRQPDILEQRDLISTMTGNSRLMLARLYYVQNRQSEALVELASVLAYHKQLGIPVTILLEGQSVVPLLQLAVEQGIYASYAAYLLELLGADEKSHPVYIPHTAETLTPREVEVLDLVTSGYNNRAIAEQLVISEWTVKSHLTKIYRKLDVTSRAQAIVRARELGHV